MRQLVKNGVWQVPEADRPSGWQSLGVRESSQTKIVVSGELDIRRCDCGRSIHHEGRCYFRVLRERQKLDRNIAEFQAKLVPAVQAGARWLGADDYLYSTALVMLAGLYTRDVYVLARFTGVAPNVVKQIVVSLESVEIWKHGGGVLLGEMDAKDGDLEFWLIAMSGAGQIRLIQNSGGQLMFDSIRNKRQAKAAGRWGEMVEMRMMNG